jgi:hypothetical protein
MHGNRGTWWGVFYLSPPNSTTLSGFFFSSPSGRAMIR